MIERIRIERRGRKVLSDLNLVRVHRLLDSFEHDNSIIYIANSIHHWRRLGEDCSSRENTEKRKTHKWEARVLANFGCFARPQPRRRPIRLVTRSKGVSGLPEEFIAVSPENLVSCKVPIKIAGHGSVKEGRRAGEAKMRAWCLERR